MLTILLKPLSCKAFMVDLTFSMIYRKRYYVWLNITHITYFVVEWKKFLLFILSRFSFRISFVFIFLRELWNETHHYTWQSFSLKQKIWEQIIIIIFVCVFRLWFICIRQWYVSLIRASIKIYGVEREDWRKMKIEWY